MPYIGVEPASNFQTAPAVVRFSGDGSDTTFTLIQNSSTSPALLASIDDKPLVLYSGGNFNGDFTADVYITYQVIQLW